MSFKFIGYDFEYSSRTSRLQNLGLEPGLKFFGWDVIKPKKNENKLFYWLRIFMDISTSKSLYLYWIPSYKPLLLLFPAVFISRNNILFGIRDLWYGNPQPINTKRGILFNRLGYLVFFLFDKLCAVKWIVISEEMKYDLIKYHPFINASKIIVSSTGDFKRENIKCSSFKNDLGYFGTFDLQMDINKYKELKANFQFIHFGYNDFGCVVDGYLKDPKLLEIEISSCKLLVIFGVNDYSRLNRKIFQYLQTDKPILYFGPLKNVTYRILSNYNGVYFNISNESIKYLLTKEKKFSRNIDQYLYKNITKKLHESICNS